MDADNNGKIDLSELRGGLRKLCLPSSSRQAQKIMDQSDSDKDGQLDVNEFKTFLAHNLEELQRVFNQIDVNNDGKISADEVRETCKLKHTVTALILLRPIRFKWLLRASTESFHQRTWFEI
jgi:Ca2+-binding EF-hand superfamily protein